MPLDGRFDEFPVILVREPGRSPLVLVLHDTLEVGRDSQGLLIDDPQASRSHLKLTPTSGGVTVTDMGSTNGTFLDGEPVTIPTRLVPGSLVRVGATTIELLPAAMGAVGATDKTPMTTIQRLASDITGETMPRPPGFRKDVTLTIVFTDIESSTEIANSMGDRAWYALLTEHNEMVRKRVEEHHGVAIKSQGDGFMLAFDSTQRALHAMIAVQRDIMRGFEGDDPELRIRIGAHTGEAISDESGDLYGYHVNLAARIADQAIGGEIVVSEILKQIGDARGEFHFGEPREVQLKGLSGNYNLYPVDWRSSAAG